VALLKKKGIWFRHVVKLHIESDAAKRAVCGTRYDPFDGAVYHPDRNWPEDVVVAQRLVAHPHHKLPRVEQVFCFRCATCHADYAVRLVARYRCLCHALT
jgi:hypothetical protein